MQLLLTRLYNHVEGDRRLTQGELQLNGKKVADTLEDEDRGLDSDMILSTIQSKKVYGRTAIPTGEYSVYLRNSPRFGKQMPYLSKVKGYSFVMIHTGNDEDDTEGCILVGRWNGDTLRVENSRVTFAPILEALLDAHKRGEEITIKVERSYER